MIFKLHMIRVVAFLNNPKMHLSALQRSVIDPEALRQGNFLNDFAIFLLLCNQLNTIIYVGVHGKGLRSNRPDLRHLLVFFCHSFCFVGCGFFFEKLNTLKVAGYPSSFENFSWLYQLWKMKF